MDNNGSESDVAMEYSTSSGGELQQKEMDHGKCLDEVEVGEEDVITLLNSFCKEPKRAATKHKSRKRIRKTSSTTRMTRYVYNDNTKESDNSEYLDEDDEEEDYNDEDDDEDMDEAEEAEEGIPNVEAVINNDDCDDTPCQVDLDNINIDEKNKPRCTNCKRQYKPGWKDVVVKLGKNIIIPSPNDNYYEFTCTKCSPDHSIHFKHTPKTYQSIIATGMYNMAFLKKGGSGYFCANEIIDYLLKYKKRLPAKSPIDGETYIRRIRSTISAFPHVFERCSKNGKRTGVRYRLVYGNKRIKGRKIGYKVLDDEEVVKSQDNEETTSQSQSSSPSPQTENTDVTMFAAKGVQLPDEKKGKAEEVCTKVFVEMDCVICTKKSKIEWSYSSEKLLIIPGPTDDHLDFTCASCNNDGIVIEHKPKPWAKIMATALYNLELIHTRQFFHANDVYKFVDSHWDEIAKGKQREEGWEKAAISSMYSPAYSKIFVCHSSKIGYWGLRDACEQPPPYKMHFAIEKIIAKKSSKEGTLYCVKWAGFDEKYNTWEPVDRIHQDIVDTFEKLALGKSRLDETAKLQDVNMRLPPKKDKIKMEKLNSFSDFGTIPIIHNSCSSSNKTTNKPDSDLDLEITGKLCYETLPKKFGLDNYNASGDEDASGGRTKKSLVSSKRREKCNRKKPNSRHLTCSDCGKYIAIDPIKYPEARHFVFPTPKDFQYTFLCASCNSGTLSLQHKQRTEKQKLDMARYNLQLIGEGKEFTDEQLHSFIECHPDDFNPQDKKSSSDESDSETSSDDGGKTNKSSEMLRKNKSPPNTDTVHISPPLKKSKKISTKKSEKSYSCSHTPAELSPSNSHYLSCSFPNSSPNSCAPTRRARNGCDFVQDKKKSISTGKEMERDKDKEKEEDVFMYFENQHEPFGFNLRETILDEDVAQLGDKDLFISFDF